jgi:small subunit ribosomal protein S2
MNPIENEVLLHECGLFGIPTIGIIDTDANPARVTYPIPANDDSLRSVALIAGTLGQAGKEGQRLRKEAALAGRTTYDTELLDNQLRSIEGISQMVVSDNSTQRDKGSS